MTEIRHTPGPWGVVDDTCPACRAERVSEFTIVGPPGGNHGQFSKKADAILVAAAPDLLAACKLFAAYHDDYADDVASMLDYSDAIEATKAAIRKATEG